MGSLAWGVDLSARGIYQAEKYIKLMIMIFLLLRCVRRPEHYQLVLLAWLGAWALP